jgi:hypothetical protein
MNGVHIDLEGGPMDIDQYVRTRQLELAADIASRKKIYLDVRFWIYLREAALGTSDSFKAELLAELTDGVRRGKLICPISSNTFIEVMKQSNSPERRVGTITLIDQLSSGVSVLDMETRVKTEIAHFIHQRIGTQELYPLNELVWTKAAYTLGYIHPHSDEIFGDAELQFQKFCVDKMWRLSLGELNSVYGMVPSDDGLKDAANQINQGIKDHAADLVSFEQTYKNELEGALHACECLVFDVLDDIERRVGRVPLKSGSPEWRERQRKCRVIFLEAFVRGSAHEIMRTVYVHACLHAGLRWQKRMKFTDHHVYDFDHAAAALSYCDAFFTEHALSNLINANHIRLDKLNGCQTTDSVADANRITHALAN